MNSIEFLENPRRFRSASLDHKGVHAEFTRIPKTNT